MYSVTLPFIGKDITKSKVEEVMVKLCFGTGITIEIYENYDSNKIRAVGTRFQDYRKKMQ